MQVWPDDMGNGFITDNGKVQAGQGVYYHTAMYTASRNQLSEMIPPGRIYGELGRFARAGATNYLLVNVSDVRPVPLVHRLRDALRLECRAVSRQDRPGEHGRLPHRLEPAAVRRTAGQGRGGDLRAYYDIPYHRRPVVSGDNQLHTAMRRPGRQRAAAWPRPTGRMSPTSPPPQNRCLRGCRQTAGISIRRTC